MQIETQESAPPLLTGEVAAPAKPSWRRRLLTRKFLFVSVLVHVLFACGAAIWVVQVARHPIKRTFQSVAANPNPSNQALEYKVQMKQRNALSAPVAIKRATTLGPSKFALPAMPLMPAQPTAAAASRMTGMGGAGASMGLAGPGVGTGFGNAGGALFMASIGGMSVQARQLAVALDVSGSVAQYHDALVAYVAKTFKGSEVSTFTTAAFKSVGSKHGTIGTVVMGFLNSPRHFDAIYVFSDFGEISQDQDELPAIETIMRERKVRLYLHVLRAPGKETRIPPNLANVIAFAKNTGGNVKIGEMPRM